ncbi:MAG: hypothetical protein U1E91_05805 [Moraxella sp.]
MAKFNGSVIPLLDWQNGWLADGSGYPPSSTTSAGSQILRVLQQQLMTFGKTIRQGNRI